MELRFTLLRSLILLILVTSFWAWGGFDAPELPALNRPWIYSLLMFLGGAVMTTMVDHWVGNLDRTNLRWMYILFGVLLIGGSLMYQHVLHERDQIEAPDTALEP